MSLAECWGTDAQVSNGMTQEWLPWVPDWKHPWIITDGAKLKFVCSFVLYHSHHSVLPKSIYLKMDIRTSCVTSCLSAPPNKLQFLSQTLSPPSIVSCHLRGQSGSCTLGHFGRQRGETGWLIGDISPEGMLRAFWRKRWLTVSVCSVGRHGTQRWVSEEGQNGKRWARMGTTNKVMQTVSPLEL